MTDARIAARALIEARRTRAWLAALPEASRPRDAAEAYAIQTLVAEQAGPVAGWKVGAATAEAEPFAAPLHASTVFFGTEPLRAADYQVIGAEAEIAYRLGRDLPPRATPYSREEVLDAVASLHPAIEIADTRFRGLGSTDPLSHLADQQSHGALVVGPALTDFRAIVPVEQPFALRLDGRVVREGVGGNTAGDPVRMLAWLAQHAVRLGGLRAGMVITTGSVMGCLPVPAGTRVQAEFPGLGTVETAIL
ncbi:fumarylacetoacetate hydrolase family protein [Roseomonas sp. OT10]|uniref:2-keto-4-pentenoate hydratase n=1 Tax=Roseomonas cutis TaxID=2897332 RepID=UPI001E5ED3B9|nr:fumarylacetoacetate hydrolase family protein [Roseomonas sp. OT10]UFN51312.1 fumarylacetoacetate hydrolase family protein [Roseomonas sp. OT10]